MGGWNNPQSGGAIGARRPGVDRRMDDSVRGSPRSERSGAARSSRGLAHAGRALTVVLAALGAASALALGPAEGTRAASAEGPPTLREETSFEPAGSEREPLFGRAVAIAGTAVVVACPREGDGGSVGGTAHVFGESKRGWRRTQRIRSPSPESHDHFASALAADGSRIVIGRDRAPKGEGSGEGGGEGGARGVPSGAAAVYRRTGLHFQLEAELLPPSPGAGDDFGSAVAIDGPLIAIGAPRDDEGATDAGSVAIFALRDGAWQPDGELRAPDPSIADWFGSAVAVRGEWIAVGAYGADPRGEKSGAVYLFRRGEVGWALHMKLAPRDLKAGDWFGFALALESDWLAVGAPRDDSAAESGGSVRLFERRGDEWTEARKLLPARGSLTAWFGYAIAIDRDRLLVGAPGDDTGAESAGRATLFERREGSWLARAELLASSPQPEERFGSSVDLRDDRMVVGRYASEDEPVGLPRAWLFRLRPAAKEPRGEDRIRPGDADAAEGATRGGDA